MIVVSPAPIGDTPIMMLRRRLRMLTVPVVLAALCALVQSPVAAEPGRLQPATPAAKTARIAAERRLVTLQGKTKQLQAELDRTFAGAADLAEQIEKARQQVRLAGVAAFVNGESEDRLVQLLAGEDPVLTSGRVTLPSGRAMKSSDALAEFQALKADNDPALVALVERREALASRVAAAEDSVRQARAAEADAERADAAARLAQERELAAARRAELAAATVNAAGSPTPAAASRSSAGARPSTVRGSTAVVPVATLSGPLPALPPVGPSEAAWAKLRNCESSGNYRAVSSSGLYRGAYQFDRQTWRGLGGSGDPAAAPPIEQDARAKLLYSQRGARPWPHCGRFLT